MTLIRALAASLLGLTVVQFTLVGIAVFTDGAAWEMHRAVGTFFALPLAAILILVRRNAAPRHLRRPAAIVAGLYLMQFGWLWLGSGMNIPEIRALHAVNGMALAGFADALFRATGRNPAVIA